MPVKEKASAITPGSAVAALSRPAVERLKASATVATVKNTPSAWISSSFFMPSACMNGIDGITCTPVAAEITPGDEADDAADPFLVAWSDGEGKFAQADDRVDHEQDADQDGAVARIGAGHHARLSQMPTAVPSISGHSRLTMSRR